jgi:hypothetical protein
VLAASNETNCTPTRWRKLMKRMASSRNRKLTFGKRIGTGRLRLIVFHVGRAINRGIETERMSTGS